MRQPNEGRDFINEGRVWKSQKHEGHFHMRVAFSQTQEVRSHFITIWQYIDKKNQRLNQFK